MDDDEFKAAVLAGLGEIGGQLDGFGKRLDNIERDVAQLKGDVAHLRSRSGAIVARLNEQDTGYDRLHDQVDRLAGAVRSSLAASEQALSAVTTISRRVTKLEHPDTDD